MSGVHGLLRQHLWQNCCHGNSIKDVILCLLWWTFMVPSFKNTALIFLEYRLFSFYHFSVALLWHHHWSNLHSRKTSISLKRKKIFQKEKRHSSLFWKAFQMSRNYFFCVLYTLYNCPNYSCTLIGSPLWCVREKTHDWLHHYKVFLLCFEKAWSFGYLDNILRAWAKDKIQKCFVKALSRLACV